MDTGVGGSDYGGKEGVVEASSQEPRTKGETMGPWTQGPGNINWIAKAWGYQTEPALDLQGKKQLMEEGQLDLSTDGKQARELISFGRQIEGSPIGRQPKLDQMEGDFEGREKSLKRIGARD
ncbi:hypothetical protein PPACK8108_LOCUS12592 [Phakopsora pachyrhizi]|uniref:Uncharacterized protein n=1 Tax=Phakopsora pachyrhizi TaxID=170000 RepID=A0AAV0B5L8_PHAPC|nr:hypothetical protein PPACK8108_LOCUS12592 [Phakopsora pachyrhizi]